MLNLSAAEYKESPFPMLTLRDCLSEEDFAALNAEFPDERELASFKIVMGGRSRLASEEPGFYDFISRHPAWQRLYEFVNSRSFIENALARFSSDIANYGGTIPDDWTFDRNYFQRIAESRKGAWHKIKCRLEARIDGNLWLKTMRNLMRRNSLFVHFDISAARDGYEREVHHDNDNRVLAFLIYFTGSDSTGGTGGELGIHKLKGGVPLAKHPRQPDENLTEMTEVIPPERNLLLMFLSTKNSYHSVSKIAGARAPRKFIYVGVTSGKDTIWTRPPSV